MCTFLPLTSSAGTSDTFDPYAVAVYDVVLDGSAADIDVFHTAMSSDGNMIYFTGQEKSTGNMVLGYVYSDGSDVVTYDASDYNAFDLVVNGDGSRAYFISGTTICKVEDDVISKVIDIGIYYPYALDTTDSGDHVYCTLNGRKGVLKFNAEGMGQDVVVQGNDIEIDDNVSSSIHDFAVSSDGQTIAFLVDGYVFEETVYDKPEVFSFINGKYEQLTSTAVTNDGSLKMVHDISADGNKVLYLHDDIYHIISSTGSDDRELGSFDGWGKLDGSGKVMFISDSGNGVLVDTASSQELILFPREGMDIAGDIGNTFISSDGKTISFTVTDEQYKTSIYVGHFYSAGDNMDLSGLSFNMSDSVEYSADASEGDTYEDGSEDESSGVSKTPEVTSTGDDGSNGISDDAEYTSSMSNEKKGETESVEKSAGYSLTTPFLLSVFGLCSVILSRKG
ncbi:hypothetical protein [Methanolobus sp. WCC4]|uniref:hypothetical protein n=1 Tax=Methanolobus sp. WCC4 TaxID=3125784 RepID=UPI0030FB356C